MGSTSYITDASGEVYQHLEYMAFGETFVEEHTNTERTPYLFNGKELDEETGMHYYGSRYYDARTSLWASVDPMAGKAPGWTPYRAFFNSPVNVVDPDGLFEIETGKIEKGDDLTKITKLINEKYKTNLTIKDIAKGNNIKIPIRLKQDNTLNYLGLTSNSVLI